MKQQLNRILNADISGYKIAVTERINSLEQIDECLTERSSFLQNFQDILRKQMEKANIPLSPSKTNSKIQSKANKENSHFPVTSNRLTQNQKSFRLLSRLLQKYFSSIKDSISGFKASIQSEVNLTKDFLRHDFESCLKSIVQKTSQLYELRIQALQRQIERIRTEKQGQQNKITNTQIQQPINTETRSLKPSNAKQLIIELDASCLNSNGQGNRQSYFPDFSEIHDNECLNSLSIEEPENHPCQFSFESKGTFQDIHDQSSYKYSNQKPLQSIPEMTLKNNREPVWKHYVCDISGSSSSHLTETKCTKRNKIQNNFASGKKLNFDQTQNQSSRAQSFKGSSEPTFHLLLRKNVCEKNYDIPAIRSLIISYPPVEEGFSTLKLGNEVVYKGMWKLRKFHGKGKLMLSDYIYEGQFRSGLFEGRGILKIGNVEFIGEFKENKAHGEGTLRIGSKSISGKWRENLMMEIY